MNDEEFIIKFYACDSQEQFLKDVNHNLNCLQQENLQLKERIEYLQRSISRKEETIRDLQDELVETPKESELLNRINKAIEYIEKDYKFANYDIPLLTKDEQLAGKLLELLKGGL